MWGMQWSHMTFGTELVVQADGEKSFRATSSASIPATKALGLAVCLRVLAIQLGERVMPCSI